MDTKDYILTNATELFNRQGATATSFRQVATYLDMSDGNLRYHFKNKEALILASFRQMVEEMEASIQPARIQTTFILEQVQQEFRNIYFSMYRYKFIFLEFNILLKQYPSFRKAFTALLENRKVYFHEFVGKYKAGGVFTKQ